MMLNQSAITRGSASVSAANAARACLVSFWTGVVAGAIAVAVALVYFGTVTVTPQDSHRPSVANAGRAS